MRWCRGFVFVPQNHADLTADRALQTRSARAGHAAGCERCDLTSKPASPNACMSRLPLTRIPSGSPYDGAACCEGQGKA